MTDDDRDPEELLQQSKTQSRHTSEPATSDDGTDAVDRMDAIKTALLAVQDGDVPENINIRDARLKALLVGLEESGELAAVAQTLADLLESDADLDSVTQSDVARLLMRVGLQEGIPDVLEEATEARQQAVLEQTEDF